MQEAKQKQRIAESYQPQWGSDEKRQAEAEFSHQSPGISEHPRAKAGIGASDPQVGLINFAFPLDAVDRNQKTSAEY